MAKFSANLGFLWNHLPLPEAIIRAHAAGFTAVECHWPYDCQPDQINRSLRQSGLSMIAINTRTGKNGFADFGVTAMPGRQDEARQYIDEAIEFASKINCPNIHAMAGKTGRTADDESIYCENLAYACQKAAPHGINILIEPINKVDAPAYHLSLVEDAIATINTVGMDNLKLMFDCYHIQIMQGDLHNQLQSAMPHIGHIQIAAVPDRSEPDHGDIDYQLLMQQLDVMGWQGHIGAEYKPAGTVEDGLDWLKNWS